MGTSPASTAPGRMRAAPAQRGSWFGVRCRPEWLTYVAEVTELDRAHSAADFVTRAIEHYAAAKGLPTPPKR